VKSPNLTCRDCGSARPEAAAGDRCGECGTVLVPKKVLEKYPNDPVLGRVVGGKYAVVSVLGVGGFGAVYRAVQEPVGRHVALKVVHSQHVQDAEMRARFFREARVVARLSDPSVVTLFDYGEEPTVGLYMVFELVSGRNLGQLLEEGPQDPVWTAYILLQVLRALGEAHRMGMVHRDIKPANMMVVDNSRGQQTVRLLDFGIAKVQAAEGGEASLATREGLVLGTPRYMSPEQAKASADVDARSDLYSLGVVAYALVAGRNPFERPSVVETIMAHVATPPPPLPAHLHVPPAFEAVLMKALEKEPSARFQDADEMAAAVVSAFPHVAFPALNYEFRAAPAARLPSLLGAAADLAATPTPSAGLGLGAALAEPLIPGGVSPMPPPDVSPTPTLFAPTLQVDAPKRGTPLMLAGVALLVLGALGVAGAAWWSNQKPEVAPSRPVPVEAPAVAAPTPAPAPVEAAAAAPAPAAPSPTEAPPVVREAPPPAPARPAPPVLAPAPKVSPPPPARVVTPTPKRAPPPSRPATPPPEEKRLTVPEF
jgi:serine/threonine protein kinase